MRRTTKLKAQKRRDLQVIAAVARDAVLQLHVTHALKHIDLAANHVSVLRMLAIYTRLHSLTEADAEMLVNKVLAIVGQQRRGRTPLVYVEGEDENIGDTRSFVHVVRDRLRGRVLHDLRRWVELHTGSTQVALLELHVRHACRLVAELKDTHDISESLAIYSDLAGVPANMTDALYIYTLERLAAEELPRPAALASTEDSAQVPLYPPRRRRSRRAV